MKELLQSLIDIQQRLNVGKNQTNNFGHFNYRSLEDIEAAIKPLLKEHQCGIRFTDETVERAGRVFLKTTLYFFNTEGESITTTSEAEHPAQKTGMDSSQITGAASSYARKYAMNAMFAIDDTKDADTNQYQTATKATTRRTRQPKTEPQTNNRLDMLRKAVQSITNIDDLLILYGQHSQEIGANPEFKELFTERKNQLQPVTTSF